MKERMSMTTNDFLAAELAKTQTQLKSPILDRTRWAALCDDRRLLQFLQQRATAADFNGVQDELQGIAEGRTRVPDIGGPRRKAEEWLRDWAGKLGAIA